MAFVKFWQHLGGSGRLLGGYWRLLCGPGRLLAALVRSWAAPGRLWAALLRTWAALGQLQAALGRGVSWVALGRLLDGGSWACLGDFWAALERLKGLKVLQDNRVVSIFIMFLQYKIIIYYIKHNWYSIFYSKYSAKCLYKITI